MEVYKWMEEIKVITGYNRSCLYDFNRNDYQFVPKSISDLLCKIEYKENLDHLNDEIEKEWGKFLVDNEYFFKVPKKLIDCFTELDLSWEYPSKIISAIIDDSDFFEKGIEFLNGIFVKYIVVNTKTSENVPNLLELLTANYNFTKIDFIISDVVNENWSIPLRKKYPSLGVVLQNSIVNSNTIKIQLVGINIPLFTESLQYNTYFNRKTFFNCDGDIFNSIESIEPLGNLGELQDLNAFINLIESPDFQKYWTAKKDNTDICKDCEFRYMCVDQRLPSLRKKDEWFHFTECDYNPYISKWKNENGYRTLFECGIISNENEFSIDHNKVALINSENWEE